MNVSRRVVQIEGPKGPETREGRFGRSQPSGPGFTGVDMGQGREEWLELAGFGAADAAD